MANKYSMIRQHQPLRTPAGWSGQEKAFIVQLEEIFDDIYRKFGRLGMNDMDKKFRITIDGKYDIVNGIEITENGVEVSGSKYVNIISGSKLYVESTNFKIDSENKYMKAGDWVFDTKGMHNNEYYFGNYSASDLPATGEVSCVNAGANGTYWRKYVNRQLKTSVDIQYNINGLTGNWWSNLITDDITVGGKSVKLEQTSKADPSASGTSDQFIATLEQNSQGVITATKKTVKDYTGATANANGVHGLVPAASSANRGKFLRGDGYWETPTDTNTWRPFTFVEWKTMYSASAGGYADIPASSFNAHTGMSGWTPVAVCGYDTGNSLCFVSNLQAGATGSSTMMCIRNTSGSSVSAEAKIKILYLQN